MMSLHGVPWTRTLRPSSLQCNYTGMCVVVIAEDTVIKFMTDGVLLKEVEKVSWLIQCEFKGQLGQF